MSPKRGERVAPPPPPGGWELRHGDSTVAGDWELLVQNVPTAALTCYTALSTDPLAYSARQKRLRGDLGTRTIGGATLPQWQYEVTSGGRVWYCPDPARRIVYLTLVSLAAPRQTHRARSG